MPSILEEESDDEIYHHVSEVENPNEIKIGVIADTESTLGFLLAGVGYQIHEFQNYLMVSNDMTLSEIEQYFYILYARHNIGVILLDYNTAKRMHHVLEKCKKPLPVIVIIPTKTTIIPYMEEKDKIKRHRYREAM